MATLPDASALGERPAPQLPRRTPNVAEYRPTTGFEDAPARELKHQAGELEAASHSAMLAKEQQDMLRAEEATTQLRKKQIDMTFGESGFSKLRGGDAVNRPLLKDYGTQFDKAAADLSGGLDNDFQRKLFMRRAQVSGLQLREDIARHVESQSNVYADDVFKSRIDTEIQAAALRWSAPDSASVPMLNIDAAIHDYAVRTGKPPEWVTATTAAAQSKVYDGMVRQAAASDPMFARSLLVAYGNKLTAIDRAMLEEHVKRSSQPIEAKTIADRVMLPSQTDSLTRVTSTVEGATATANAVPTASRDTKAMLGEWISRAEAEAQRTHPDDPLFRDMVVTQVKSRVATIVAAQEGIQRQAHGFLLTSAAGINQDGSAREPKTNLADLLANPQARAAWDVLDGPSQLAITTLVERNAERAAGKPAQANAKLEQQLLSRLYLPENDARKITKPEQLTQFAGPGGLTIDGLTRLRTELTKIQNPEGRDFQHDVNLSRQHVLNSMRNSLTGRIMNETDPGSIDYAALRWYTAVGDKIDQYRKEGKDPRNLLRADTPDSMMTPAVIQSFLPNARQAVRGKAEAASVGQFETKLSPAEETQFQTWKAQYAPNDSGDDYDLRGAFKAGLKPDAATGHFPDTFKKPNHPTFSVESQYAKERPDLAGSWAGPKHDVYVPRGFSFVANDADYNKLKPKTSFVGPDGVRRVKP